MMNNCTCPLQNGPAPMPIVGIFNTDVAAAATGAGTHSNTTEKQPASCKASAVSTTYTHKQNNMEQNVCEDTEEDTSPSCQQANLQKQVPL